LSKNPKNQFQNITTVLKTLKKFALNKCSPDVEPRGVLILGEALDAYFGNASSLIEHFLA
jgi:hypothetical protein